MTRRRSSSFGERLAERFADQPESAPTSVPRRTDRGGSHAAAERAIDAAKRPGKWDHLPEADREVVEALARGDDRAAHAALRRVQVGLRRDRRKVRRPRVVATYLAGRARSTRRV